MNPLFEFRDAIKTLVKAEIQHAGMLNKAKPSEQEMFEAVHNLETAELRLDEKTESLYKWWIK